MRHPDWLVPDWPAPATVRAVCTTRAGGVSAPPYDSLNLGNHVGDAPAAVQANRDRLQAALAARPVFLQQVHGADCAELAPDTADGLRADACHTQVSGAACTIMVADCLPVLFCDRAGTRVAAAHAGWRGLADGVLEAALAPFGAAVEQGEVLAWLGPCIGPTAFEVGPEVKAAFEARHAHAAACFAPGRPGKWLADLPRLARLRLRARGVTSIHGNDGSAPWCTVGNTSRFFSHRRDTHALGASGRFAACVWLG